MSKQYGKLDLRNMDCMELMKKYPDNHFDMAICDPPYFDDVAKETFPGAQITKCGTKRNRYESVCWDVPDEKYFTELFRVSKRQIIWGCNYYAHLIPHVARIVWDKINDTSTFSHCEIASKSWNIGIDIIRYRQNGFIQGNCRADREVRIHPTQKPVALYKRLLKYAKEGDKILDTHLGSGSIAIACHYMSFDLTGSELDPDYYKAMMDRIERETAQQELF